MTPIHVYVSMPIQVYSLSKNLNFCLCGQLPETVPLANLLVFYKTYALSFVVVVCMKYRAVDAGGKMVHWGVNFVENNGCDGGYFEAFQVSCRRLHELFSRSTVGNMWHFYVRREVRLARMTFTS